MQQPKKEWTKPVLEQLDVPVCYDSASGMPYETWKACKSLRAQYNNSENDDAEPKHRRA